MTMTIITNLIVLRPGSSCPGSSSTRPEDCSATGVSTLSTSSRCLMANMPLDSTTTTRGKIPKMLGKTWTRILPHNVREIIRKCLLFEGRGVGGLLSGWQKKKDDLINYVFMSFPWPLATTITVTRALSQQCNGWNTIFHHYCHQQWTSSL